MYHYEAMKMREKINDHHGLANSFLYLGEAYMAKKDYEKARYYFENSLQKNHYLNDRHGLSVTYLQLGSIEYEQGNYKKAANLYDSSLQIAATAYLQPDVKAACDKLAITYTKLGKFESAYDFLSKSVAINDSLNNAGNKKKIAELQASYEIKQLQRETERQNRERERKNALQYSGIFFITILLFVCIFIFGRFNIAISLVEKMLFFTFLLCFEFILLLTDPYVENITNREPSFILLANALIALFIVPIHQYLENRLKNKWFRNENRTSTVNEEMARNETTARRGDAEIM
jgi:tetratricopeptide (TPR) repeat protein